eukprot:6199399-Pleurochrysis_carterae.AAC.2
MALAKTTVNIDRSPAQAWVAPEAETEDDTLSAGDDTGSESGPKCIPENALLSHLNEQPSLSPRRRSNF